MKGVEQPQKTRERKLEF